MYKIIFPDAVTRKAMPAIPKANREQLIRAIHERLAVDPIGLGKPLQYNLKGYRRLRVGDWRVIYRIDGGNVIICDIANRRDVYG